LIFSLCLPIRSRVRLRCLPVFIRAGFSFSERALWAALHGQLEAAVPGRLVEAATATEEADERISDADRGTNLKYRRQANRNRTISKLRDIFRCLIMEPDADLRGACWKSWLFLSPDTRFPLFPAAP